MNKSKLINGCIIEINLPNNIGKAYAKYCNVLSLNPNATYPDLLYIYDCINMKIDFQYIEKYELLFHPILVAGLNSVMRKGEWVNVFNPTSELMIDNLPEFKYIDDDTNECYLIKKCSLSGKIKINCEDNSLINIGDFSADGTGLIELRIAFKYLYNSGKRIEEYFDIKDYMDKSIYNWAVGKEVYKIG